MLTPCMIRYLLAIYELSDGGYAVRSTDISRLLSVTRPSVAKMLGTLEGQGLIEKPFYGSVHLTEEGIRQANRLYTKCTLVECFFKEHLRVSGQTARRDAAACLACLSDESVERMTQYVLQGRENGTRRAPAGEAPPP